jgi:hypothetical protein
MLHLKNLKHAMLLSVLIVIGLGSIAAPAAAGPLEDALDNPVQIDGVTPLLFSSSSSTASGLWSAETATWYPGGSNTEAAQSGPIGNSMYSSITTTVTGPATLAFYQKVSSQPTYDTLTFSVDGSVKSTISGNINWQQKAFTLPSGTHTLVWKYAKNTTINGGLDAAWLDKVAVSPNTALKVTYPNGGENLVSGSTVSITWNAPAAAEKYDLYYTTNNGTTWTLITSGLISPDFTGITYPSWTLPVPAGNLTACKVKVVAKNNAGTVVATDISDKPFAINNVRLTAPNGGNFLAAGGSFDVTWNSTAAATSFSLYYSLNNGTTWTSFATNRTGTDYLWLPLPVPPAGNVTTCKVKIVAYNGATVIGTDTSDAPFTMGVVNVTAPNGDIVSAKTGTYTIGFLVSGLTDTSATATISYTINGGSSWPVIGMESVPAPGSYIYPWPVPAVSAVKNAKVKVVIKNKSGVVLATATSNAFTILPVFTISGTATATLGGAALAGVTMTLGGYDTLGGYESGTATTDPLGKYSFTMLLKGNYTVSAAETGYYFSPPSAALAVTTANVTANFKATTASPGSLYTISGNVSGATTTNVTVTLAGALSGSMMTDGSGNYSFANLPGGESNYNVTPAKTGYTFNPTGTSVVLSNADATGIDFTATQSAGATYSISGKAIYNGAGVPGATVTVSGPAGATVLTDAGGNYIVKGLKNGTYTLTPSSAHAYDFSPSEAMKTVSGANITGVNFTGLGPVLGTLITSLKTPPIASFTQNIPSNDHTGPYDEIFPGMANLWSLDADFSLANGFDNQFNHAEIMGVGGKFNSVESGIEEDFDYSGGGDIFPPDQMFYDNCVTGQCLPAPTFYTPLMGTADGVEVATVSDGASIGGSLPTNLLMSAVSGSYAAFLNATSDSRLQQTLDLTSLPTGSSIKITWNDAVSLDPGPIIYNLDPATTVVPPIYQVVLRKQDGTLLKTLLAIPSIAYPNFYNPETSRSVYVSKVGGQKVVLSFEMKSSNSPGGTQINTNPYPSQAYAIIDNVSVGETPAKIHEYVTNGDFESGAAGWTTNTPAEVQNITSGARTTGDIGNPLGGLSVKRSFYTVPNKLWGRWVDVFSNLTSHPITTTVAYETELGSSNAGIIYDPVSYGTSTTTAPNAHALTAWDSSYLLCVNNAGTNCDGTRDIGLVFGNASTVNFLSADGFFNDGSDFIDVTYDVTVPAYGMVAIVNFVIMDGTDTGYYATGASSQAAEIDVEAKNILNNFWTDPEYRDGMTSQQISAISNFPKP